MSAILCRSGVNRCRTYLVRMLRLDALHRYYPIISVARHLHWNSQPNKPISATSRARETSDSSSTKRIQLHISARIVACVENHKYDEALDLLHEPQHDDKLLRPALYQVLRQFFTVKLDLANSLLFMAEFWDMYVDHELKTMNSQIANSFASSFAYTDDVERMQQLANRITQKSPTGSSWISAISLVSHVLAHHGGIDAPFQRCVAHFLNYVPSYTVPMLHHEGAIASLISKKQVDEAVDYLKSHAASLQISNSSWSFVMKALYAAGRSAENVPLYELWMSVLPLLDELKQRANYQTIVPNVVTCSMLLGCDTVDPEFVISQLDVFGVSSNAILHNSCINTAAKDGDHHTALRLWGDMCERGFAVNTRTMSALTDIVRFHAQQPEHLSGADTIAVMLWDKYPLNGPSFQLDWYAPYMSAFRRLDDIQRTLQLMRKLRLEGFSKLRNKEVIFDVLHVLKKHNQMAECNALVKQLLTKEVGNKLPYWLRRSVIHKYKQITKNRPHPSHSFTITNE